MRNKPGRYLWIVIALLFLSCEYQFSDDYFNDLEVPDNSVNITLINFSAGEVAKVSKTIRYGFTGVVHDRFEMAVYVDGLEIYRSREANGEFNLALENLEDGNHQLTIDYISATNNKSLASIANAQFYTGTESYNFASDKSIANSFGIAAVNIVEGSIYITLNPITDTNFDEAILLIKNEDGYLIEERPITEEDLTDLEIHDYKTIGYNPSYAIKVKNTFTENSSDYVLLPTEKMNFTITPLSYDSFYLNYNEHPFYGNFNDIGFSYTYTSSGFRSHEINPRGGQTFIDEGYSFGIPFNLKFNFITDSGTTPVYERVVVGTELPILDFEEITYLKALDTYYVIDITPDNEMVLHQLNGQSFALENSKTLTTLNTIDDFNSLEVDSNNNLIINMNQRALLFNPLSFSVTSTHRAVDYNSSKASADVYYRGDYVILEETLSSGEVLIYEKATKSLEFSITKTTNFFSAVDASYFYANRGLYQLQGDDFVFLNSIQRSGLAGTGDAPDLTHMTFDKTSNSAVFGWYRSTFYLDLSNLDQYYLFGAGVVLDVKYSEEGQPLINSNHFSGGNRAHLYDSNIDEYRTIDTAGGAGAYTPLRNRYFNGYILSPNGYYLKTNLYSE